jgi:hypothetical protein
MRAMLLSFGLFALVAIQTGTKHDLSVQNRGIPRFILHKDTWVCVDRSPRQVARKDCWPRKGSDKK